MGADLAGEHLLGAVVVDRRRDVGTQLRAVGLHLLEDTRVGEVESRVVDDRAGVVADDQERSRLGKTVEAPAEAKRVDVAGRQFYWEFRYPDGSVTYDTLVAPVGRNVDVRVTAPGHDVIHSWWIPALGGKIDAIPGRINHTWFRAEETGEYEGSCTEFCGLQHAEMTMVVRAVDAAGYEAELARLADLLHCPPAVIAWRDGDLCLLPELPVPVPFRDAHLPLLRR